jgi:DNA polymerase III epsilon subunit-like protein
MALNSLFSSSPSRILVFDLETGGTTPSTDGITEIGAVVMEGHYTIGAFQTLVAWEKSLRYTAKAIELQHKTEKDFENAPTERQAIGMFAEWVKQYFPSIKEVAPWAHNAKFDVGFLHAACERVGWDRWPLSSNCSLEMFRRLHRGQKAHLEAACGYYGINTSWSSLHTAQMDAWVTGRMIACMLYGPMSEEFSKEWEIRERASGIIDFEEITIEDIEEVLDDERTDEREANVGTCEVL